MSGDMSMEQNQLTRDLYAAGYRGKYYTLTDQRIPYRRDKTEDERFFILTLFAIAHEIEAMGQYERQSPHHSRASFCPR